MNRDQIVKLAQEIAVQCCSRTISWQHDYAMTRIMELIDHSAAQEREQCARLVEPSADHLQNPWHYLGGDEGVELLLELAAAIRQRVEQ